MRRVPLLLVFAAACGETEPASLMPPAPPAKPPEMMQPPPPPDETVAMFDADRLLDVRIEVDPGDWETLRHQGRTFGDILGGEGCLDEPFESVFNYFRGTVTIDGDTVTDVGVRKKGFLGSLSETKPALKIKFHEYVAGQTYSGMRRLTLNNGRQDPALIRQCLGYQVLRDTGVPAARCNFAKVTVNGQALGIYAHVESMKKPFIRRHFESDSGNFYEGTLSDFRPEWINTFDRKTNKLDTDRSDLEAVMDAAGVPDGQLLERLDAVIDLDSFFTIWAAEVLIGHWDGYAGNTNNFYIYADPKDGRFTFMPWGVDAIFGQGGNRDPNIPQAVMAQGVLAHRLYAHPTGRRRYFEAMRETMDGVWDEVALRAEVERMQALIGPEVDAPMFRGSVAQIRDFIAVRRGQIEREMANPRDWPAPLRDPPCFLDAGELVTSFETRFGTHPAPNPFVTGTGTLAVSRDRNPIVGINTGSAAGWGEGDDAGSAVVLIPSTIGGTAFVVAYLVVDPTEMRPGTWPVDGIRVRGALLHFARAGAQGTLIGWFAGGTLELEAGGTAGGDTVRGRLTANLLNNTR